MPEKLQGVFVNRPFGMISAPPTESRELLNWITRSAINDKDVARGKSPTETQHLHKASSDCFDSDFSIECLI